MPPAFSDEDNSENEAAVSISSSKKTERGRRSVAYRKEADEDEDMLGAKPKAHRNGARDEEEHEEEGGDHDEDDDDGKGGGGGEEEEEEEYVVEKILSHQFQGGALKFEVKWEGYEKKSDRTWEPEENLKENASAVLEEYFESVGGREMIFKDMEHGLKNKKRGRPSSSNTPLGNKRTRKGTSHPRNTSPPAATRQSVWKPPAGSWEDEIAKLDACEDEETGKLMVYLTWKSGHRTQHETGVIYKRCPQQMLKFYERHVRIIKKDADEPQTAASPN